MKNVSYYLKVFVYTCFYLAVLVIIWQLIGFEEAVLIGIAQTVVGTLLNKNE